MNDANADYGGSFDPLPFDYPHFSYDDYEPWQNDGQREDLETAMPASTCLDSYSNELGHTEVDVAVEASTPNDGGSPKICYGLVSVTRLPEHVLDSNLLLDS